MTAAVVQFCVPLKSPLNVTLVKVALLVDWFDQLALYLTLVVPSA